MRERRFVIVSLLLLLLGFRTGNAYETWSEDPESDTGNCAMCHGKFGFVEEKYTSLHDGTRWFADLMTGHGTSMLIGCMECHRVEGDQPQMARCASCHGRAEDGGMMQTGAGLRNRHRIKGIAACNTCHSATESAVAEHVVPAGMRAKGIDPCNDAQFGPDGLDNDGDGLTDSADPDCQKSSTKDAGVDVDRHEN